MKKGLTEVVVILDKTGSMFPNSAEIISEFNRFIQTQKALSGCGEAYVTTVLFNTKSCLLHDRLPLSEVPEMTAEDYHCCGVTSLLDAVGTSVSHIRDIHKYIREEDVPEHTLFAVISDGSENSSFLYTASDVNEAVAEGQAAGWNFVYAGIDINEKDVSDMGFGRDFVAFYPISGPDGSTKADAIAHAFDDIGRACTTVRSGLRLTGGWKQTEGKEQPASASTQERLG